MLILLAVFPRIEHERNMKVNTGIKMGIFSVFLQKKKVPLHSLDSPLEKLL